MSQSTSDTPVLDLLATMTTESLEASSLDPASIMSVRLAALVATGASPASYALNLAAGAKVLAAVRPERIAIAKGRADGGEGSRLTGAVAQIVYLGTLMQFHVDTAAERRFIVHQLSSEASDTIDQGDEVTLTWPVDDTSILTVGD